MAYRWAPSSKGYTLGKTLGAGQFGTVYKARNSDNDICALKCIDMSDEAISDWKREVNALSQVCGHPNVVEILDFFVACKKLWIEMEYCNGGTLNDYVIENNPNTTIKHPLMVEMSSGVAFLHANGIIHRDLKPDNIMIDVRSRRPHAKVADFGLAKILADQDYGGDLEELYLQTDCGTPYFVAPEVYSNRYTVKADVFSLGIIFHTMVAEVQSETRGGKEYLAVTHEGYTYGHYMSVYRTGLVFTSKRMSKRARNLLDAMISNRKGERPSAEEVVTKLESIWPEHLS